MNEFQKVLAARIEALTDSELIDLASAGEEYTYHTSTGRRAWRDDLLQVLGGFRSGCHCPQDCELHPNGLYLTPSNELAPRNAGDA